MSGRMRFLRDELGLRSPYPWIACLAVTAPLAAAAFLSGIWGGFRFPGDVFAALREPWPLLTAFMGIITKYGAALFYVLYGALFIAACRARDHDGCLFCIRLLFFNILISLILLHFVKDGLGMPRPGRGDLPMPWSGSNAFHSFPSGHTAEIVGLALCALGFIRRLRGYVLLALIIFLVGYSRIWLGQHHPADVLAGIAVGTAAARFAYMPLKLEDIATAWLSSKKKAGKTGQ